MNNLFTKTFDSRKIKLSKLVYSVVALVLILSVLVASTFSWLMSNFSTTINTSDFITIDADAGLEMNYGEDNEQGAININDAVDSDFELVECSSIDGKNFFFPLSEYSAQGDGDFASGVSTNDLVFREGTANDKNNKYISIDFSLTSENSTDVWLSSDTKIYSTNKGVSDEDNAANALRVAFIENKPDGKATIFDNSITVESVEKNSAVKAVSTNGELLDDGVGTCDTRSFNEFFYGNNAGNVLFHIDAGETLSITMNIWLEGTDKNCTASVLGLENLQINIKFTTSYEALRTIYFIDNTLEGWVDDDDCYVYLIDEQGTHHRMSQSSNYANDRTWSVPLPEGTETIRFVRYDPVLQSNAPTEWNYWDAGNLGNCSTYVAFGHSAGMWSNSFSGTTITLLDGTPNGYLNDNNAVLRVMYDVVDGNGNTQSLDYKMSYQNEYYRWQIVIPSQVTDISFKRLNSTLDTVWDTWSNIADRGNNQYITINYNTNSADSGYWSNQLIYVEDEANVKGDDAVFAICFYTTGSDHLWTAMRAHFTTAEGKTRYVAAIPDRAYAVLTRYNITATTWGWNWQTTVYNQANDYKDGFDSKNFFKTSAWTGDNVINGTWYHTNTTW